MKAREKILNLLRVRGLSQIDVAEKACIAYSTFRSYLEPENPRQPSVEVARRIAHVLGVTVDGLWDDSRELEESEDRNVSELGDFELVAEIERRRRLIIQDMRTLAGRFDKPEKRARLEELAARAWGGGFATMPFSEQEEMKAGHQDLQRLQFLERRLEFLDPAAADASHETLTAKSLFEGFPNVLRWGDDLPASNEQFLFGHYVPGRIAPVAFSVGTVIDADRYYELGAGLQWHFIPIVDDPENGPPPDNLILYERSQPVPERFKRFLRFSTDRTRAFAYIVRDESLAPEYPAGTTVICDPVSTLKGDGDVYLVVFEKGKKQGLFRSRKRTLENAIGHSLQKSDAEIIGQYCVIAGPIEATEASA